MLQKSETPASRIAGASRDLLGGWSRAFDTLTTHWAQFLIAWHAIRPTLAAVLATAIFEGGVHG